MRCARRESGRAARARGAEARAAGVSTDPVLEYMERQGLPRTRAQYLALAYKEGAPDPLPAELEAEIPEELRDPAPGDD